MAHAGGSVNDWLRDADFREKMDLTSMKTVTLDDHVTVAEAVVSRDLDNETVLLNLDTGIYFGLDPVASDMWRAIQATGSLHDAYEAVCTEYDAEPAVLQADLLQLVAQMLAKGLLQTADPPATAQV